MMNQKMLKRIFGVFIVTLLSGFIALPVVRADVKWCTDSGLTGTDVSQRYGITLTSNGNNSYTLQMNPKDNQTERCKTTFHITKINGQDPGANYPLSCSQDASFYADSTSETSSGLDGVVVVLESDDKVVKNEHESNSCYYAGVSVTLDVSAPISAYQQDESCPSVVKEDPTLTVPMINCNQVYPTGSFEQKFCYAKQHAGSHSYDFTNKGGKYSDGYSNLSFKCIYDVNDSEHIKFDPEELKGDAYYVNKQYIYGTNTEVVNLGNYGYYYSPGFKTEGSAVSCEVTCEESVEVEYGPPVASKAGMCFEYKVRVTSRTSCNMSKAPELPKLDCNYCTPTPQCISSGGGVWLQGGPNEDFDACVRSCDGGKYTKKCSNKCYNQVYGKKKSASKMNYEFLDDFYATKLTYGGSLSECLEVNKLGCYIKDSSGNIEWQAGSEPSRGGEGRWYYEHDGKFHNGHYLVDSRGFWRHQYSSGAICNDSCTWIGCSGDVYINPNMAGKDYESNMALYNEAVATCKSKAVCSETTAEFTISADYSTDGSTNITIDFPYDKQKDTIQHSGSTVNDTASNANSTLLPNEPDEGNGLLGCYKKGDSQQNLYRSTWSFPGTWINAKTGEISYVPKDGGKTSWREHNDKFCVPADAESVNADWWNLYNHKLIEKKGIHTSIFEQSDVKSKCENTTTRTIVEPVNVSDKDIVWNIHARTAKFGYFDWYIQMDCFYAINELPTTPVSTTSTNAVDEACNPAPDNYRVRPIDLEDVFPSNDGTPTTSKESAGRTPGFNWSTFADNTKNENYVSKPQKYMQQIQKLGYAVYDDDHLDYEFYLSPQTIRSMRKNSSGGGYTGSNYSAFDDNGFYVDDYGVSRYKSKKIRGIDGSSKIPSDKALLCNNMVSYRSSVCDTLSDD